MPFQRFEEIKVWQDARELTTMIYKLTASELFPISEK